MEIRRAVLSDIPGVFTCCISAFKEYILLIGKTPAPMLTDYCEEMKQNNLFVACQEGEIAGFALVKDGADDYMWLDTLAVNPKFRKRGIQALWV